MAMKRALNQRATLLNFFKAIFSSKIEFLAFKYKFVSYNQKGTNSST